ncbi:MAG: DNA-binding protein [Methyloceanibacter sp.]|jgi:hypothetical protein
MELMVKSNKASILDAEHDLIWTGSEIAKVLNLTERQCWYLLERGALPARKIGGKWVASRRALLRAVLPDGENTNGANDEI